MKERQNGGQYFIIFKMTLMTLWLYILHEFYYAICYQIETKYDYVFIKVLIVLSSFQKKFKVNKDSNAISKRKWRSNGWQHLMTFRLTLSYTIILNYTNICRIYYNWL